MKNPKIPARRTETVTYIDYREVEALVANFLGIKGDYNLVADMGRNHEWCNDSLAKFTVDPENPREKSLRKPHLKTAMARQKVEWAWELDAVLNEIGRTKPEVLPKGEYIVEICW
jgi:hypothetical protein